MTQIIELRYIFLNYDFVFSSSLKSLFLHTVVYAGGQSSMVGV